MNNLKLDINSSLRKIANHAIFVSGMVILWLCVEYSVARMIRYQTFLPYTDAWENYLFWCLTVIFFSLFLCKLAVINEFKISSLTLKKMMSNALGFKWLSLLFILTFMMQLTWFIDATYKIFVDAELGLSAWQEGGKAALTLFSILIINLLFPTTERYAVKNFLIEKRTLLVSAFSVMNEITDKNIDLFLKPFHLKDKVEQFPFNKVVIIISNTLSNCNMSAQLVASYSSIFDLNRYNSLVDHSLRLDVFKEFMQKIIEDKYGRKVEIVLSAKVDYNIFDTIFFETIRQLKNHENNTTQTVVHISPGSAIVSGALTALAIKGNRLLLYTEQKLWTPQIFDINVFSIEDLLSELWGEYEADSQKVF